VLGGVAKVSGSIIGPMLFWAIYAFIESVLRQITEDGPVRIGDTTLIDSTKVGQVVFMLMGLMLVLLMTYRPQGLFGNRRELAFDGR
jgi:branched-chain amino acid transport system permease protein